METVLLEYFSNNNNNKLHVFDCFIEYILIFSPVLHLQCTGYIIPIHMLYSLEFK